MTGEYKVDYEDVYSRTAELKSIIEGEISSQPRDLATSFDEFDELDGATHVLLQVALLRNHKKTLVTFEILSKLLLFIANSAKQIELQEKMMANLFSS